MVGGWWGLHSHFHVHPNYSVEVVLWLCIDVVEVVTIFQFNLAQVGSLNFHTGQGYLRLYSIPIDKHISFSFSKSF